jgi:hypothetical protein
MFSPEVSVEFEFVSDVSVEFDFLFFSFFYNTIRKSFQYLFRFGQISDSGILL